MEDFNFNDDQMRLISRALEHEIQFTAKMLEQANLDYKTGRQLNLQMINLISIVLNFKRFLTPSFKVFLMTYLSTH